MSSRTPRTGSGTREIASRFEPTAEATALLAPGLGAADFVAALVKKELWSDATGFVGQWLAKRDAVLWACLAARNALGEAPPPKERAALEAAERWLKTPDEPSRRACAAAAEALEYKVSPAMAAAAAAWSGGSLSKPDLPPVPPPENLTGTAASGAVRMAGVTGAPDVTGRLKELIRLGVEIAEGRYRPGGVR